MNLGKSQFVLPKYLNSRYIIKYMHQLRCLIFDNFPPDS